MQTAIAIKNVHGRSRSYSKCWYGADICHSTTSRIRSRLGIDIKGLLQCRLSND